MSLSGSVSGLIELGAGMILHLATWLLRGEDDRRLYLFRWAGCQCDQRGYWDIGLGVEYATLRAHRRFIFGAEINQQIGTETITLSDGGL